MPIHILSGDGSLFWNGGMIVAWKAAIEMGPYDGYLWLNNDTCVLPCFWQELLSADANSQKIYRRRGIYVGSTRDSDSNSFTYGGFVYTNKFTLKDKFILPDGNSFQPCEAAHGNITYVSADVVKKQGIFTQRYHHGGSDHDYTYLAHKAGFPVLVLPNYSGICINDHKPEEGVEKYAALSLKERLRTMDLHNTLLFNRRCFPWRYPFVLIAGYTRAFFPNFAQWLYLRLRS